MKTRYSLVLIVVTLAMSALMPSCKKDPKDPEPKKSTYVQNWIYDNMKYWYYWTDQMPANPDTTLDPEEFFYSLLYNGPEGDRFSWIEPNY
ncbi:MAG TPA: hypothetical protein PKN21_07175, partial [Bacteroidales bacterium]|nr:hypothetical protein [Bacteroidales bacterium]